MLRIVVDPTDPDAAAIAQAAAALRAGQLVAFPTETVYGLGANALDPAAVERIYAAKGRPSYNPLIVHVARTSDVSTVAREWNAAAERLAAAFWPGPLTLVLPKLPNVPDAVTAGLPTVAVRVPRHPVAQALLRAAHLPVAAPSANKSMLVSPSSASHVVKSLGDAVDIVLDGGPTEVGIESTVIDVSGSVPTLLRPGMISIPALEAIVGPIAVASQRAGEAARPSPGMLDRHYSPRGRLLLVDPTDVRTVIERERAGGRLIGAIVREAAEGAEVSPLPSSFNVIMPRTAAAYATRLYDALHTLDDAACDVIVVERVPDDPDWLGVRDRLERAAH